MDTGSKAVHNNVTYIVCRAICAAYNLEHSQYWRVEPEQVAKNNHGKILWDFLILTDKHLFHNGPDIMLVNNKEQTGLIIDIAVSKSKSI